MTCQECKGEWQVCPYCECACELVAKTHYSDEDCYCHRCNKPSFMSLDGTLVKEHAATDFLGGLG